MHAMWNMTSSSFGINIYRMVISKKKLLEQFLLTILRLLSDNTYSLQEKSFCLLADIGFVGIPDTLFLIIYIRLRQLDVYYSCTDQGEECRLVIERFLKKRIALGRGYTYCDPNFSQRVIRNIILRLDVIFYEIESHNDLVFL